MDISTRFENDMLKRMVNELEERVKRLENALVVTNSKVILRVNGSSITLSSLSVELISNDVRLVAGNNIDLKAGNQIKSKDSKRTI